jgi:hypothetical protein
LLIAEGRHAKRARRGGKPPEFEDPRKDFHLAGAIYIQSGHCDFISQMMFQTKVYCMPLGASNSLKSTLQETDRQETVLPVGPRLKIKSNDGDDHG